MKGFDYSKVNEETPLYDKLRPIGIKYLNSQYKLTYYGLENIPEDGGVSSFTFE